MPGRQPSPAAPKSLIFIAGERGFSTIFISPSAHVGVSTRLIHATDITQTLDNFRAFWPSVGFH